MALRDDQGTDDPGLIAHHTAGHQKYGDTLEQYRRYLEALGLSDT
jgi:hypothetical protein